VQRSKKTNLKFSQKRYIQSVGILSVPRNDCGTKKGEVIKMGQITIELDAELESRVQDIIASKNISLSRWIENLIQENISREWQETVRQLAGAWKDFPSLEEIRKGTGDDIPRESF
jgi:hypothetical protein